MIHSDTVQIAEYYEGGRLVKKTVNGIEIPLTTFEKEIPVFVQQTSLMTREEAENLYGPLDKLFDASCG
jgi:hypothetical protein